MKLLYDDFMKKYLDLGHMREVVSQNDIKFYFPHHFVLKPDTSAKKFRVVFNASAKSSTNISLNECLAPGPHIQEDLVDIVLRFCTHNVAICSDVEKMYRQILVHEKDQVYQGIIYRENNKQPLRTFKLLTLTYGTTPAAYLATRCLREIVDLNGAKYPLAKIAAERDFWVDDILTGQKNTENAIELRSQLQEMLQNGGFPLRKWASNDQRVLNSIPPEYRAQQTEFMIDTNDSIKTLGLSWYPSMDSFKFKVTQFNEKHTKRTVLSDIAKLYDTSGFVSPIIGLAKLFMQTLWAHNLDWDSELPHELSIKWAHIKENLDLVSTIEIPRRFISVDNPKEIQIFGFSDASEKMYGICIYLVALHPNDDLSSRLVFSKSKVAPLKTQSIPRLELCAFLMLAAQIERVKRALTLNISSTKLFTDSQIVLSWINKEAYNWKVFVANRVSKIRNLIDPTSCYHVISEENPADIVSKGSATLALKDNSLWWNGPKNHIQNHFKTSETCQLNLSEKEAELIDTEKKNVVLATREIGPTIHDHILERHGKFSLCINIMAYVLRFVKNCREKEQDKRNLKPHLCFTEMWASQLEFARASQIKCFREEVALLKRKSSIQTSSKLFGCRPFYDNENRVLRVGGRLAHSGLPYNQRHPIILPHSHDFTMKLFIHEHQRLLHAGPNLLLGEIRRKWWPIKGRRLAGFVYMKCVKCFKVNPKPANQVMGHLPAVRVCKPSKPFENCGIDYGGPFITALNVGKRCRTYTKSYFAVFICMATKAVHIELVTDASTEKFMMALRRFISVRGRVATIHCDNATNFHGADNEMTEFYKMLHSNATKTALEREFVPQQISFKFIPASSPHVGGLWESNVKAVKFHMKRIMGLTKLNFEELFTLLKQIEACLNSRPICKMSESPEDFQILTPGHFLTGDSLVSIPEPDYLTAKCNRLTRFQLTQRLFQDFWKAYQKIVYGDLQVRYKWNKLQQNIKVGDVVLVKDDNLPPLQWKLGRITQVFPGKDNEVRQVELKSNNHTIRRTIHKLCILPMNDDNEI